MPYFCARYQVRRTSPRGRGECDLSLCDLIKSNHEFMSYRYAEKITGLRVTKNCCGPSSTSFGLTVLQDELLLVVVVLCGGSVADK